MGLTVLQETIESSSANQGPLLQSPHQALHPTGVWALCH